MISNLTESTALLHAVVNTSPEAIITIDVKGINYSFNPAAERLFGHTASDVLGKNVQVLMPPAFRARHDEFVAQYAATGEPSIIGIGRIVTGQHKNGSHFPMELFVGETSVDNTRLFVGFIRDLSELDRQHRRVQELQSKLFHVSRLGEAGQMASGLAHEVAQPLAAIMNYAQAARRISISSSPLEFFSSAVDIFEKIEQQAWRAVDIIKRLRRFVEKRESERDMHDLYVLIDEALELSLVGPAGRGVRIQKALMPGGVIVCVDRVQIQQVLVNILHNAIDATEGMARRDVTIATAPQDDDFVRVAISDTGPGIAPDIADRLFESFITTKPQGLGVGLSISKSIIEAHGGQIWFEPGDPTGATFHFTLPRVR